MEVEQVQKIVRYTKFAALAIAVASLFMLLFLVGDTDAGANWGKPGHRVTLVGVAALAVLVAVTLQWVEAPPVSRQSLKPPKPPKEEPKKKAKPKPKAKPKAAAKKKAAADPKVDQAEAAADAPDAAKE